MRNRKDIEADYRVGHGDTWRVTVGTDLILELLLDIRALLAKRTKKQK